VVYGLPAASAALLEVMLKLATFVFRILPTTKGEPLGCTAIQPFKPNDIEKGLYDSSVRLPSVRLTA